jgi:hypothetical protein
MTYCERVSMPKLMKAWSLVFLVGYIAYWFGITESTVGTLPTDCSQPYPWWLPWAVGLLLVVPATLGYEIGRASLGKS